MTPRTEPARRRNATGAQKRHRAVGARGIGSSTRTEERIAGEDYAAGAAYQAHGRLQR
jgi:hypothetical protein